ncbi:serine/threonine-protein kinase [Streptomyces formicae]|uniref:non-specific serine/threonine protein kinase n=1 Tax=Streptomyces formicae TaxID=1616117 RepID=A0A291QDJ8_9ACTN|nr:serine/threonine-protein kinase [Streptomyces formicae]ATL29880.1 serine/threonine protein kinase [Streptomyces formicae]
MSDAEQTGEARRDKSERLLAGRYRLGEVLGRGGMGTVWRAKDETLGRTVAVKELRFPSSIDEEEKRRLITRTLREAKAIARIRNTSAVTVYDVVDEDDRPWIVMELVEGKSLAEAIREDGLLTPRRAAEVGLAVLDVLRSAHREGILHRDVKPSNVLIAEDGRVVLTDFGIAQVEGDPSITSTGMLVGAPSYISPERARGHKPGPAADMWSLGGLLYAAVEGVPPYDKGSAIATLTAVMTEDVEQPVNAGPLEKVIYGLLAKDPEQRLDDVGARALLMDVIHAPEPKAEPEPVEATKVVPLPPVPGKKGLGKKVLGKGSGKGPGRGLGKKGLGASGSAGAAAASSAAAPAVPAAPATPSVPPVPPAAPSSAPSVPSAPQAQSAGSAGSSGTLGGRKAEEAADRLKGALRSARKAAASATARGAGAGAAGAAGSPQPGTPPRAPVKASLTDVVPRRTLVIVSVVAVLAVLGTVLAFALGGDDKGSSGKDSKGGDKAASSGATAGGGAKESEKESGKGEGSGDGKGTGADSGKGEEADKGDDPGKGDAKDKNKDKGKDKKPGDGAASTYKHGQGFSIGLPKGWKYQSTGSAGARFTGPNGQKLLVGWTTTPKDNPVADWKSQENYMVRSQYHRIRIEKADYRDWNTADWEFTYVDGGTKYRSIDRGFVVNGGLGYGMMYTAKADDWGSAERKSAWRTLTQTFEPKS